MAHGDSVPDGRRPEMHPEAAGVHSALRHLGRLGTRDHSQPSNARRGHRLDGARAFLLGGRSGAASRQRSGGGREGGARVLLRARAQHRWHTTDECSARHLVRGRRWPLRHADRRVGNEGAREDPHRQRGALLVSLHQADVLSGSDGWARWADVTQDGPASESSGASSRHRFGARILTRHHSPVRGQ